MCSFSSNLIRTKCYHHIHTEMPTSEPYISLLQDLRTEEKICRIQRPVEFILRIRDKVENTVQYFKTQRFKQYLHQNTKPSENNAVYWAFRNDMNNHQYIANSSSQSTSIHTADVEIAGVIGPLPKVTIISLSRTQAINICNTHSFKSPVFPFIHVPFSTHPYRQHKSKMDGR